MKKYWVVVKNGSKVVALFEGGNTFKEAKDACDGNYGVRGVSIIGPMTEEEAQKVV